MTYVTCRLTAKNQDQLRHHTLSNRVGATFTFCTAVLGSPAGQKVTVGPESRGTFTARLSLLYKALVYMCDNF